MIERSLSRPSARALLLVAAAGLSGCASLPSSGPTAGRIERAARAAEQPLPFDLVDIDPAVAARLTAVDVPADGGLSALALPDQADRIGAGDVLAIAIYEVGASLFSGGAPRSTGTGFDPSARGERFPAVVVDSDGTIRLPYVGRLEVAGQTTAQVEQAIEVALIGKSQRAQALVTLSENVSRGVYVSGDVRRPGRVPLTLNRERLLDAVAAAGGTEGRTEDVLLRFLRGDRLIERRLSDITPGSPEDLTLLPGDRVQVTLRPRSFTTFGAAGRVAQVAFESNRVTLAEAIARVGGPSDSQADASAVFLFRDAPGVQPGAPDARPVVYRLNMLQAESYFLAQRIPMRDKDVIYVAGARSNQPAKLFGILNLLFSPFITARQIAN